MILIPMAGKSSRFYKAGYNLPKFKLPLGKESNVFRESLKSFEKYFQEDLFIFITRTDDDSEHFVRHECRHLGITDFKIVSLDYETRGQADSVAIGIQKALLEDSDEPVYIFNIDSIRKDFTKPTPEYLKEISGFLEVFEGEGDHWSFADPDDNNFVKRTTEKIRISKYCSNGLYYFSSSKEFMKIFKELEGQNYYKELFVAPMYNIVISHGGKVKYRLLEKGKTVFSGIPEEYTILNRSYLDND